MSEPVEATCTNGAHHYSPVIMGVWLPGVGPKEYLRCEHCPHNLEVTDEMRAAWLAHYQQCVAEGIEYHGIMGDYVPPGSDP